MRPLRIHLVGATLVATLVAAPAAAQPAIRPPRTLDDLSDSFQALAARVTAACVAIESVGYAPLQAQNPTAAALLARQRMSGSGFIIDPDGYIVTNAHVIRGARRIQVTLGVPANLSGATPKSIVKPQGKVVDARLVGMDAETDLAVLKIDDTKLPVLALADSDALRQGQVVFAFGSPFGLQNSVSMGIVSAVARQRTADDPMVYVQTDAPINPGNSGGPLVDTQGRVVGINTLIFTDSGASEGVGFAAPSNIVRHVFDEIRQRGRVRRGVIGVNAQTITPGLAAGLALPQAWGVILADVYPESPAERAGLQIGDIVLTLDGKVMENGRQFDVNVYQKTPGSQVALEVLHGAKLQRVSVAVGERAGDPERFIDMVTPERNLVPRLGILGVEVSGAIAEMVANQRRPGGVLVAAQAADAASSASGLLAGDVILAVNGTSVTNLAQLRRLVDDLKPGAACALQIQRDGRLMFVAFQIEE